jgi:AcrR family transcriptional regulator
MSAVANDSNDGQADARPLGRPPKQQDQRERILRSAAKAIATVGYEQCSLGDIAEELDLTRPALYHYFRTKQQIFTEIALTAVQGIYEHVQAAIDADASAAKQLRALMLAHAAYFEQNYWLVNATIAGYGGITRRELERIEEIDAFRTRYEKLLHRVLRAGVAGGEFHDIDVPATGRSIYQLLNITRWYRPGGDKSATDIAGENYALLFRGLSRHGAVACTNRDTT